MTRKIDLVNSPVGPKFIILARDEDLAMITSDNFINSKNNLLLSEYYSCSTLNGKFSYEHRLSVPKYLKRSPDYILLLDLKTERGDHVTVYLDKIGGEIDRSLLTVYNPSETVTATIHPGNLLEVVFIDPVKPLALPSIDTSRATFSLELLRREVVDDRDEVYRPKNRLFDIRRWVINSIQSHFFFRINPKDLETISKVGFEGRIIGPTINFSNTNKEVQVQVAAYISNKVKKEISDLPKEVFAHMTNQAVTYGLETGMFCGTQVMSPVSQNILVDRETGYQEIEIPLPDFSLTEFPQKPFEHLMSRYEPFHVAGKIRSNGYRVVNRTFLHKFLIISDMASVGDHTPMGKAEFKFNDHVFKWPVFATKLHHDRPRLPAKKESAKTVIHDVGTISYHKKLTVARDLKLIKIDNSNQLSLQKVNTGTDRLIENPIDQETVCLFKDESLVIRISSTDSCWRVSSYPNFMYTSGSRHSKTIDEFKFRINFHGVYPKKGTPLTLECGKNKITIFIKVIN